MNELLNTLPSIRNPFRDSIVGDAWDSDTGDVDAIHRDVFKACMDAVDQVRTADITGGLVVYGAAGSGKTHIIRRLRKALTTHLTTPNLSQLSQIFAYVRLDTSPGAICRHVRNRVATDLLRRLATDGVSQFELMVVARVMAFRGAEGDMLHWWRYFRTECSDEIDDVLCDIADTCGLSSDFVRVLGHLIAKRHRLDVSAWLRGESLPDGAYERLGIGKPREDGQEAESLEVLRDFARLAGSHLPLVICFDQVEALQTHVNDTDALYAYGQLIRNLSNANQNLLLISSMQSSLFKQLDKSLPEYQWDAFRTFTTKSVNPLNKSEALDLVRFRLRLAGVQSSGTEDDVWPLQRSEVDGWVGQHGITPRLLLARAAERYDAILTDGEPPKPVSENDVLVHEWESNLEHAQRERNPKNTIELLRDSLPDLIALREPTWFISNKQVPGTEFVFQARSGEARVGVALLDNSPQRLPRQLAMLLDHATDRATLQKLVLLRDERLPVSPTATATQQRLKKLEEDDAVYYSVRPEAIAALDAAHRLLTASKAGDLSCNGQTITHETVVSWLREMLPDSLLEAVDIMVLPGTGRDFESTLVDRLQDELNGVLVCGADELAKRLDVSLSEIEDLARARSDLFGAVSGEPTAIFSIRQAAPISQQLSFD